MVSTKAFLKGLCRGCQRGLGQNNQATLIIMELEAWWGEEKGILEDMLKKC